MGLTESKQEETEPSMKPVVLPGDERIHVSPRLEDPNELLVTDGSGVDTIATLFQAGLKDSGDKPCLGTRKSEEHDYEWLTYSQVDEQSKKLGSALKIKAPNVSRISVRCKNRPEWTVTSIGCAYYSYTICTINYTADYDTMKKIINQAKFKVFILGDEKDALWILNNHSEVSSIELLIVMDLENKDELAELGNKSNVEVISFSELLEFGNNNMQELNLAKPDDIFTICYTSGTTGDPKGVLLSHKAFIACVCSISMSFPKTKEVCFISYLPVAHVFEIGCELYALRNSGRIGFYRGDIRGLMKDIEKLEPTCFPVVPRLLNRIYTEVMNEVNGSYIKKYIMDWALKSKSQAIRRNTGKTIWDDILFPRIRKKLGGKIEILVVASAPISSEVKAFFKCALDCALLEAYGQTECTAVTLTDPNDWDAGHVGIPQPHAQMKVIDVPEMNYFAKDDVGEVCVRGPSIMAGYDMRDDLTAETVDKDGWLHSGDIGQWLPNGALKIIDRKKHIFKLSQGEYIAPEKIENAYVKCGLVSQIFVDGLSTENFCIALVVPQESVFVKWASGYGKNKDFEALCEDEEITELVLKELQKEGKNSGFNSLEQVKKVKLLTKPFTIEDGLLTATLKNRRLALRKYFKEDIQKLYQNGC